MLYSREDVKVGECSNNGEEDDGFYGCVGCMESERPQEGSHVATTKDTRNKTSSRREKRRRDAKEKGYRPCRSEGNEEGKATVVVRYTTDFLWTQI